MGGVWHGFSWVPSCATGGAGSLSPNPYWSLAQRAASKHPRAGGAGWGRVWPERASLPVVVAPRGWAWGREGRRRPAAGQGGVGQPHSSRAKGARPVAAEQLRNLFSLSTWHLPETSSVFSLSFIFLDPKLCKFKGNLIMVFWVHLHLNLPQHFFQDPWSSARLGSLLNERFYYYYFLKG